MRALQWQWQWLATATVAVASGSGPWCPHMDRLGLGGRIVGPRVLRDDSHVVLSRKTLIELIRVRIQAETSPACWYDQAETLPL